MLLIIKARLSTLEFVVLALLFHDVAGWGGLPVIPRLGCKVKASVTKWRCISSSEAPGMGLYNDQQRVIIERGIVEGGLMRDTSSTLLANVPKLRGVGAAGGFGGSKDGKVSKRKASGEEQKAAGKSHAAVLSKQGVVRIDNVLTPEAADALREWAFGLRLTAREEVESGSIGPLYRFADVLLKENRCGSY